MLGLHGYNRELARNQESPVKPLDKIDFSDYTLEKVFLENVFQRTDVKESNAVHSLSSQVRREQSKQEQDERGGEKPVRSAFVSSE